MSKKPPYPIRLSDGYLAKLRSTAQQQNVLFKAGESCSKTTADRESGGRGRIFSFSKAEGEGLFLLPKPTQSSPPPKVLVP
jgi:hypothetical protein